jgi:hypothetical protein
LSNGSAATVMSRAVRPSAECQSMTRLTNILHLPDQMNSTHT